MFYKGKKDEKMRPMSRDTTYTVFFVFFLSLSIVLPSFLPFFLHPSFLLSIYLSIYLSIIYLFIYLSSICLYATVQIAVYNKYFLCTVLEFYCYSKKLFLIVFFDKMIIHNCSLSPSFSSHKYKFKLL